MNEMMPTGLNDEERERQEGLEWLEMWNTLHPQPAKPEVLNDSGPEIERFEELVRNFELKYPLAELLSIAEIDPTEISKHPLREPAKSDLPPILNQLNKLKNETDISPEKTAELEQAWKRLSNAIGFINNGRVVHDR